MDAGRNNRRRAALHRRSRSRSPRMAAPGGVAGGAPERTGGAHSFVLAVAAVRALIPLLLAAALGGSPSAALAAATETSFSPSAAPDVAGAQTALTVRASFSANGALPSPLRASTLLVPNGFADARLLWPETLGCARAQLLANGVRRCPEHSQIGSGSAQLAWHEGGGVVHASARLWAFVGPTDGPYQIELLGESSGPLRRRIVITESLAAVSWPFGARMEALVPPIPTRAGVEDATIESFTLTIGAAGSIRAARRRSRHWRSERARLGVLGMFVPRTCPTGGFPWRLQVTFANGESKTLNSTSPCP